MSGAAQLKLHLLSIGSVLQDSSKRHDVCMPTHTAISFHFGTAPVLHMLAHSLFDAWSADYCTHTLAAGRSTWLQMEKSQSF